ncbi:hypothetical protein NS383_01810, partial [Pseudomonas oryzihabitans]
MKRSLADLVRRLRGKTRPRPADAPGHGDIAVIGMACRVPGAAHYRDYWNNLAAGHDSVMQIPPSRWDWQAHWGDPASELDKSNARHAGCIDDVDAFDSRFFGIAPATAQMMDPQQRIMLELSWACLEDASVVPSALAASRTGVFLAAFNHDYKQLFEASGLPIDAHQATASAAAIIANRLSHFYDLRGPSVLLDTACSGSLNAIHQAVQSLRLGESDLALAGGINLLLTPTRHISFAKTGMLSPTGACHTFDEAADGYVRSEGAGLLLLKRLDQAMADGDPIHGVIKGSAVNHCGKTHTLTYPSAAAQAEVIGLALDDAGVDPGSITYIEAHGTGTPKGDPIEVQGLRLAFAGSVGNSRCGLGSAKANIGHLEAAAGVAGVIKVLMSMKAGQLPPLCHFTRLNPRIDLADTRFYPVSQLQPWQPSQGPLRAGVSSFGFGGTNGHVVLEQAPPRAANVDELERPGWLIVLSGKSATNLDEQRRALRDWLLGPGSAVSMADLSQVLLSAREHFGQRQAWVVRGREELLQWLDAPQSPPQHAVEQASPSEAEIQDALTALADDREPMRYLRHLAVLSAYYLRGATIPFSRLFEGRPRRHLEVPGYAFARERCWLPLDTAQQPCVSQRLEPDVPCLRDHVIGGRCWVAGAVQMAALAKAWGARPGQPLGLSQLTWLRPLLLPEAGCDVQVRMQPSKGGAQHFKLSLAPEGQTLCTGSLESLPASPTLYRDLDALRQTNAGQALTGASCYSRLQASGMQYGEAYQALQHCTLQGTQELLAYASLPAQASTPAYPFSPVALDVAFQAALLLAMAHNDEQAWLGFSLARLELLGSLPERFWIVVRHHEGTSGQQRFDIEWIAEDGRLCARAVDFVLKARVVRVSQACIHAVGWRALECAQTLGSVSDSEMTLIVAASARQAARWQRLYPQARVLMGEAHWCESHWQTALQECEEFARLVWVAPPGAGDALRAKPIIAAQEVGVMALFSLCQGLFLLGLRERPLELLVVTEQALQVFPGQRHDPTHAAVHGLAGTLARECPAWEVKLIDLDADEQLPALPTPGALSPGAGAAWRDGQWYVQSLVKVEAGQVPTPYRQGGCYLIIGGAGGIGVAWTRHLLRDFKAQVYWIGRRPLDERIQAQIDDLAQWGPAPIYLCADAADPQALDQALRTIRGQQPRIHGVIHATLVMQGKSVQRMSRAAFREVLASKVATGAVLAQALPDLQVDFVLFFSSINAFERAPTQSNYAAGCCFIDELGAALARRLPCRVGVIDWGYWADVGALANSPALQVLREREGAGLIELPMALGVGDLAATGRVPRLAATGPDARVPLALEWPGARLRLLPAAEPAQDDSEQRLARALAGRGSLHLRGGLVLDELAQPLCQLLLAQLQAAG